MTMAYGPGSIRQFLEGSNKPLVRSQCKGNSGLLSQTLFSPALLFLCLSIICTHRTLLQGMEHLPQITDLLDYPVMLLAPGCWVRASTPGPFSQAAGGGSL